jgi:hypothetical protein
MNWKNKTKKGSIFDMFVIMVMGLGVIVTVMFVYLIVSSVANDTSVKTTFAESGASTVYFDNGLAALRTFDYGIALFIFVAGIASMALATMVNTHPVFFFGSFIAMIVLVMATAILTNAFIDIVSQDMLTSVRGNFPISMALLSIYPTIALILSAAIAIIQYSRTSSVSGFGGY